jgi:hypothetical protein
MARDVSGGRRWMAAAVVAAVTAVAGDAFGAEGTAPNADGRLVIHEWGTFTALQDEQGRALGSINTDDEPAPGFVHRISNGLLLKRDASVPSLFSKGAPRAHPDVTMRLETPVVYFHPPADARLPLVLDVDVAFRGGWLSEYYPNAEASGSEVMSTTGTLLSEAVGRLRWAQLRVGEPAVGPETEEPVWLTPRQVKAADVTTAGGESERFLFYRGVGHVDSPVRVERSADGRELAIISAFPRHDRADPDITVPAMWLVMCREDGGCAFRPLEGFRTIPGGAPHEVGRTAATFDDGDFAPSNVDALGDEMREALVADGLYVDEADALLNTWKAAYFKTPGLRLFYLLPRAWTEEVLPLRTSAEATIVRTMVGRIEIVTPEQRRLLATIAAGTGAQGAAALAGARHDERVAALAAAPSYLAYQQLGRFRTALVLDELKRAPTAALEQFVADYRLAAYVTLTSGER